MAAAAVRISSIGISMPRLQALAQTTLCRPLKALSSVSYTLALDNTSAAPDARARASALGYSSGLTRDNLSKPITFKARAAAPILPGWVVPISKTLICFSCCMNKCHLLIKFAIIRACLRNINNMSPELNIAHNAVLKAAKSIEQMVFKNELLSVQKKLQSNYVQQTHDTSLNDLFFTPKRAYPEDVICLDETVLTDHSEAPRSWHLLPLDGATNFLYGIPHCAITLLLCEQKVAKQLFVFHPFNGDIFTATQGKGAFFNQRRMRLDQAKEAKAA